MKDVLILTCLRVLVLVVGLVRADCYYPDGSKAADSEKPCSSEAGAACCPDTWQCLDNGLCYNPAPSPQLWGRYSCTDQSWDSPYCPSNLCVYNVSSGGGEAITQCSDHNNQWCCDGDRVHVDCCKESPAPRNFFDLATGKAYATIGSSTGGSAPTLATITGAAFTDDSSSGAASSSSPPSSVSAAAASTTKGSSSSAKGSSASSAGSSASATSGSKASTATPSTSLYTSISSGTAGIVTQIITSVVQPTAGSSTSSSSSSSNHSHIGVIVGCAVGIPLALALVGIIAWMLYRQRKYSKPDPQTNTHSSTPSLYPGAGFIGGAGHKPGAPNGATKYKSETNVPELTSQSVGPQRPISTIQGKAELEGGTGFTPGTVPHGPNTVGLGGGNGHGPPPGAGHSQQSSWGSAPPGYSPSPGQTGWAPGFGAAQAVGGAEMPTTTNSGNYQAYRPPQTGQTTAAAGGGLQNVPEMAELSAVRTPPA